MDDPAREDMDAVSPVRLYGGSIAIVSGLYAVILSLTPTQMTMGAWFMLILGIIVLAHGILLVTPLVNRLETISGPLMLLYAALMLLHQAWLGIQSMGTDEMMGMGAMTWDPGMVSLALLMLVSGLVMTAYREGMRPHGRPKTP